MDAPAIRYTKTADGTRIASSSLGSGTPLFWLDQAPTHLQRQWAVPGVPEFFGRLAEHRYVLRFDYPGFGLSDRGEVDLSLDAFVGYIDAVTADLEPFALAAVGHAGPPAITYAARHPNRVTQLILWSTWDLGVKIESVADDRTLRGFPAESWDLLIETIMRAALAEEATDKAVRAGVDLWQQATTYESYGRFTESSNGWDARTTAAEVRAPTLVVYRRNQRLLPTEPSRELAAAIAGAELQILEGTSFLPYAGDLAAAADTVLGFLDSDAPRTQAAVANMGGAGRFRTILFSDVVASTPLLAQLKDEKMRAVMRDHDEVLEAAVTEHGGRVVKTIGDAFMAEFSLPSAAVESGIAAQRGVRERFADSDVPIRLRIGINAGEPIEEDGDLHGASVVIAKRLESEADVNGILVSDVVKQAVVGKSFEFVDRGEVMLKGFDDPVRAWSVAWI